MSNRIRNMLSTLFIPKGDLHTVYETLRDAPLPPDGWASPREVAHAINLKEQFLAWGHAPKFDAQGNLKSLFVYWEGYDEGTMSALYHVLAPFVRAGSVQEFSDEYLNLWRWEFNGTAAVRQTGRIVYENDPIPATK